MYYILLHRTLRLARVIKRITAATEVNKEQATRAFAELVLVGSRRLRDAASKLLDSAQSFRPMTPLNSDHAAQEDEFDRLRDVYVVTVRQVLASEPTPG